MKPKILFLDDDADRVNTFKNSVSDLFDIVWVKTYDEFVNTVPSNRWSLIMLDHDLGDFAPDGTKPGTGNDVARFLSTDGMKFVDTYQKIVIHSMNSVGASNMFSHFKYTEFDVYIIPGAWVKIKIDNIPEIFGL